MLDRADLGPTAPRLLRDGFVYRMVVQHEHQHDETMLATLQLMAPPGLPAGGGRARPGRGLVAGPSRSSSAFPRCSCPAAPS